MEITVVGSGTVLPELERRQSCVVVETASETLVFDLGSGAVRGMLRAGIDPFSVDRIFFTHFHPDHTVDVVPLLFAIKYAAREPRDRKLVISGPEPFHRFWAALTNVWGEWMVGDYPMPTVQLPLACRVPVETPDCQIFWAKTEHRPESIGYRLEAAGKTFVYTGDTAYGESVVALARNADTLLIECGAPAGGEVPGHLTPEGVARIASESGARRVVITHFPAFLQTDLAAEVRAAGYEGEILTAEDGTKFSP
ncbi:MBL fold metallo-hydrolase [Rubrobacter taiwanensis]|uniref:MBL fold metallo-hydrolase n=1 Tax=Rubrobacter taiwanensis TaxID=185139 RepID=UPI001404E4EE|nr:MBL fold metallo-hydrolase [Rubrobacter taiwanensis]